MELLKVDPFENVAASSLATAQFIPDRDLAVFAIILILGGTTFTIDTHVTDVTIKAGGKSLLPKVTGARIDDLNNYDGVITDAAHLPFFFGDPTANALRGQRLGSYDMTIYRRPLTIQVNIGAATAPTLDAYALVHPPKLALGLGFTADEAQTHRALIESILQPSAAVTRKAFGLSLGSEAGALIRKIGFFHSNLTSLEVKKNGLSIFEDVDIALNNYVQDDIFARAPVSTVYVFDPTVDGNQSEALTTVNADETPANYQVLVTASASDTITTYADVYSKLPLL